MSQSALLQKISEVMAAIDRVPKDGLNKFHGYNYATEAAISAAVRQELASRQLVVTSSLVSHEWNERKTKSGGSEFVFLGLYDFTIHDASSGASITFKVAGAGQDAGDKAVYKAFTGAVKYAMMKLFLIPTGDDPETEKGEPELPPPPPAPRSFSRPAQATPAPAHPSPPVKNGEVTPFKFGPGKGVAFGKLTDEHLNWYLDVLKKDVVSDDPAKTKFRTQSIERINIITSELAKRSAEVPF